MIPLYVYYPIPIYALSLGRPAYDIQALMHVVPKLPKVVPKVLPKAVMSVIIVRGS